MKKLIIILLLSLVYCDYGSKHIKERMLIGVTPGISFYCNTHIYMRFNEKSEMSGYLENMDDTIWYCPDINDSINIELGVYPDSLDIQWKLNFTHKYKMNTHIIIDLYKIR